MRYADLTTTKDFTDDDGDKLVLRTQLTKALSDEIRDLSSGYRLDQRAIAGDADADQRLDFQSAYRATNRRLFAALAVSLTVNGEKQEVTAETYDKLDVESGNWIDKCIAEVLRERRERAEGNESSPVKADDSPPSSPAEDSPTPSD